MRRRITIEMEADESIVDKVTLEIEATTLGQFAARELNGFEMRREDLPEKVFRELQIPSFLCRYTKAGNAANEERETQYIRAGKG